MTQQERDLAYAGVLVDLLGLEKTIAGMSEQAAFLTILQALEQRGVILGELQAWTALCDAEADPVRCFRKKMRPILRPTPLSVTVAGAWAAGFLGALALGRLAR